MFTNPGVLVGALYRRGAGALLFVPGHWEKPRFFGHNIIHSILKALTNYKAMTTFEQRSIRRLFAVIAVIVGVMGAAVFLLAALDNAGPFPGKELMLPALGALLRGGCHWHGGVVRAGPETGPAGLEHPDAQITEMYGGNLNAVNHVPPTSNLYDCAMQLNMIRTGIQKAVEEGTKADRTKVEPHHQCVPRHQDAADLHHQLCGAAEEGAGPAPHVMDYVNTISQKADRLNHIVQDVFEVSKAATGNITLNLEDLDLGKLLQQTLGEMEQTMERSGLVWRVRFPTRRPWCTPTASGCTGVPEPHPQLRTILPGGVAGLCKLSHPARRAPGAGVCPGEHPQRVQVGDHHGRGAPDRPVCPGGPEPHHRGQRPGAVHRQELY